MRRQAVIVLWLIGGLGQGGEAVLRPNTTAATTGSMLATSAPTQSPEFDIVILNGRIVDGTGSAWFYGDIGLRGDRITRVTPAGMLATAQSDLSIDASNHVVAPGFIDIQSHSRAAFLTGDGRVVSKVTQGITTEIMGEGTTNAPVNERILELFAGDELRRRAANRFGGPHGFDAWLRAMIQHGVSPNIGSFVGATTIRMFGKGAEIGAASTGELETMRGAVQRAMEDGAFGIASALIYPPGNFASTEELIEICKTMAPYGGVYITHMRSEGDDYLEALDEAIRIGREAKIPVEIYHLKAAGRNNWHKASIAIDQIEAARAAGIDVQANMYPYVAGSTGLAALFPPTASADGKLLQNLQDAAAWGGIKDEVLNQKTAWENLGVQAGPDNVMVLGIQSVGYRNFDGMRLNKIADALQKDWVEVAKELVLAEEGGPAMTIFMMSEDNVRLQLLQPWIKFGTDAGGVDPAADPGLVHPRAYGTFPRILGRYVRQQQIIPLEEAVRKMTSAVTTRLRIVDRGLLHAGMYADIVIFDPDTIIDHATFEKPHQLSEGIRDVLINGIAVVRNGEHTGAKPGRIVRGPGRRSASVSGSAANGEHGR